MTNVRKTRLGCERLDERAMPSITLVGGVLTVVGTGGNDVIQVSNDDGRIRATIGNTGESRAFNAAAVAGIDIRCRGGDDRATVGPNLTVGAILRGSAGRDFLLGGGGDDTVRGGGGNDFGSGRGGSDDLFGDDGHDDLRGGGGDDSLDGGRGRDGCRGGGGDDDVTRGLDLDTELIAVFTGGQGDAEFKFGPDDGGIEREFEVEVEDLTPSTAYGVFVGATRVGTITTDALGDGRLDFETDFDADRDGAVEFPAGFPELSAGSVVTVRTADGTTVREGTFVALPPI